MKLMIIAIALTVALASVGWGQATQPATGPSEIRAINSTDVVRTVPRKMIPKPNDVGASNNILAIGQWLNKQLAGKTILFTTANDGQATFSHIDFCLAEGKMGEIKTVVRLMGEWKSDEEAQRLIELGDNVKVTIRARIVGVHASGDGSSAGVTLTLKETEMVLPKKKSR